MTFRLYPISKGDISLIRIEGDLKDEGGEALLSEFEKVEFPVLLDLSGLNTINSKGIKVLRTLVSKGAYLTGVSQYVKLLLNNDKAEESTGI